LLKSISGCEKSKPFTDLISDQSFQKKNGPKWEKLPSREWIHIPPNGKFGKSSTQNANFGGYVSFLEGTVSSCPSPIVCQEFGKSLSAEGKPLKWENKLSQWLEEIHSKAISLTSWLFQLI